MKTFNSSMLEYSWSCGNSKLGSVCQQYCKDHSLIVYGSGLGFICYIVELHKKSDRGFQEYFSVHYLLYSSQVSRQQIEYSE
jgi:hypothetical protein